MLQTKDAHLLEGLRSDLFDVWVYFQQERETPGNLDERGREGLPGTTTSVSRAERRSQMTTGLSTVVARGAGGGGRLAVGSSLIYTTLVVDLDPISGVPSS